MSFSGSEYSRHAFRIRSESAMIFSRSALSSTMQLIGQSATYGAYAIRRRRSAECERARRPSGNDSCRPENDRARDRAAHHRQIGVRAEHIGRELIHEITQANESIMANAHRRVFGVEYDAVFVVIQIRRILQKPRFSARVSGITRWFWRAGNPMRPAYPGFSRQSIHFG